MYTTSSHQTEQSVERGDIIPAELALTELVDEYVSEEDEVVYGWFWALRR